MVLSSGAVKVQFPVLPIEEWEDTKNTLSYRESTTATVSISNLNAGENFSQNL